MIHHVLWDLVIAADYDGIRSEGMKVNGTHETTGIITNLL
jgi:hypothetical protein